MPLPHGRVNRNDHKGCQCHTKALGPPGVFTTVNKVRQLMKGKRNVPLDLGADTKPADRPSKPFGGHPALGNNDLVGSGRIVLDGGSRVAVVWE